MTTSYFDYAAFFTHKATISINQILHTVKYDEESSTIKIGDHTFKCESFIEGYFLSPHQVTVSLNPIERSILYRYAELDDDTLRSILSNESFALGDTVVTRELQTELDNDGSLTEMINNYFLLHSIGCFGIAGEDNVSENLLTLINRQGAIVSVFRYGDKSIKVTTAVSGEIYTRAQIIEPMPTM